MAVPTKKTKYTKLDAVHVNPGLQQLWPDPEAPSSSKSFAVEIVAIPGLGANADWTWRRDKVHWLQDSNMLSSKLENPRISVFKYQSQWFGKGSVDQRLENVADQLLYTLDRSRGDNCKIPIIFVCHCLGGIVLESALLKARLRQKDFPSIFPWVAGCVFLGTPFHGTNSQEKALWLAKMAETVGMGAPSSLLKLLEKDSDVLIRMLDDFVNLSTEAQIRVFCFFESDKSDLAAVLMKGLPFKAPELIVDRESATWPGVAKLQLASDHFRLNKYTGPKDGNYEFVSNEIRVTAKKAAGIIKSRQNALRQALIDERTYRAIIDALGKGFSDLEATVKGAYKGPKGSKPSWIIDADKYKTWKEQQTLQLLWIHGKAGTGQGSIASSVVESLRKTSPPGSIVTSFFCDHQGDENRRSLKGLLSIIVRQIIDLGNQDLAVHLLTDSVKGKKAGAQDFDPESFSKTAFLWDAIQAMAKDHVSGYIYIVIYGVEQLSTESLVEFLQMIKESNRVPLGTDEDSDSAPIKWLLLSRSGRPAIEKALKPNALEINIDDSENADHVKDALREDISARVDELNLPAALTYFVKRYIQSRAEGNYIYVSLVIQELRNVQTSGKTTFMEIRALLESFPYGLTDMYDDIRKRVLSAGSEGLEYTKEILRCLSLAQRAPTMRELAIMADLPGGDQEDLETLKSHIIRCGAFLTLRGNEYDENSLTVEWIDISAQEYLEKNAREELCLDLDMTQHGIIALRCLEYCYKRTELHAAIESDNNYSNEDEEDGEGNNDALDEDLAGGALSNAEPFVHDENSVSGDPTDNDVDQGEEEHVHEELTEPTNPDNAADNDDDNDDDDDEGNNDGSFEVGNDEGPALAYPVQYWIEHAKLADDDVIREFRLYHDFWNADSPARQQWWSENEPMHVYDNQTNVSPMHIATITGFSTFVKHLLEYGWGEDIQKEDSYGYQPLYYACLNGEFEIVEKLLDAGADPNFLSVEGNPAALYGAALNGHKDIVMCLLDRKAEINAQSDEWGTPLYGATRENHTEVMQILVAHKDKADLNIVGGFHKRALNEAAYQGNLEGVQLLIDHGAEIDPDEQYSYGSALGAAARRGHADVVKLLLSKGWSPSKHMDTYKSFLIAAATYGHVDVVEALVQKEARITVLEQALQAASQNGKDAVVKIILGATPTLRHQPAFMLAADYGRDEVLKLLWPRGMPQNQLDTALYKAADHEHAETVKLLLEFGASPDAEGKEYGTALTASAYDGTTEILEALLEKKADPNKRGGEYGTALQAAALYGDADNVKLLIDHGASVNTDPIGLHGHPLQAACYNGDVDTIRALLEKGADVNAQGGNRDYAIIAAAEEGNNEAIKVLMEYSANVNVRGSTDNAPLIVAAAATLRKEDLEPLLDAGADINAQCDRGVTALISCADACDAEGLEFLISHGADVHIMSEQYGTALQAAAAEGDEEACAVLIKAGADVDAVGGPYGTPLQAAAWAEDIDSVKVLLDARANVHLIGGEYGTALQAAAWSGNLDVVQELLDHGAEVNQLAGKYGYPLQAAALAGHWNVVELLLNRSADVNAKGGLYGFALLAAAAKHDNDGIVELLLDHGALASVEGGVMGSAVQAAAYGNNIHALNILVEHGADPHVTGGKYGHALQAAAVKADMELIDVLFTHGVDVGYRGGKYDTALQAAAYAGDFDLVNKLLDHGADFRLKGGTYGNAINAAAVRGKQNILEKFLAMGPPEQVLDEALVEACYHRQTESVEALLKSGANIYARHTSLGLPVDALRADAPDDNNSDDGYDQEDEDDDDNSAEDDDDEDEQWEGDNNSVAGETEGSVTDLQLEEEASDESRIQKLLDEAMARVKRHPSVQRFKTVKRKGLPPSLTVGPPPLPRQQSATTSYTQFNPPSNQQYGQQQYPQARQSYQAHPAPDQYRGSDAPQVYTPPSSSEYAPYRTSANSISLAQSTTTPYQTSDSPPRQALPHRYSRPPVTQQYSRSNESPGYGTPPVLSPRPSIQDFQNQSTNNGASARFNPPLLARKPVGQVGHRPLSNSQYASPPSQSPYASPPKSQFGQPPQQSYFDQSSGSPYQSPPANQYHQGPPPQLPTGPQSYQQPGYAPYSPPSSSQTSFHSDQSTQYGGSAQSYGYNSRTNSSHTSGWSGTSSGENQPQANKWRAGGYDGAGYG